MKSDSKDPNTQIELNDLSKSARIRSLANSFDIALTILGIALVLTLLGRVFKYTDDPLSNAQILQAVFGGLLLYLGSTRKGTRILRREGRSDELKKLILLFPFTFIILFLPYRLSITDLDSYARRVAEGSLVEWMSFIFLFFAGILLLLTGSTKKKHLGRQLSMLGGGMCLVLAMEEMSWGQMIFNWDTPEIFNSVNIQHETNIHNLEIFHNSSWTIAAIVFCILTSCSLARWWLERSIRIHPKSAADIILPPAYLLGYFSIAALIYVGIAIEKAGTDIPILITREQEIAECLFSMGVFLNACRVYISWGTYKKGTIRS